MSWFLVAIGRQRIGLVNDRKGWQTELSIEFSESAPLVEKSVN